MLTPPFSHYLFDADKSQQIDRRTIEEMGISGFTLMELAGSAAAKDILTDHDIGQKNDKKHGLYLLGKGNNAGDALVVARYLSQHDFNATMIFLSGADGLSDDARKNFSLLKEYASDDQLHVLRDWDEFDQGRDYDFVTDGMLGTGLNSDLKGDYANAVEYANEKLQLPIFAMDIPTGLHADTGRAMGSCLQATKTYAFGGRKQGFYLKEGPSHTGTVEYCELPFPNSFKSNCSTFVLDESWVPEFTPKLGQHKYASGVLYVIAGSPGLTGAAIMAAKSAWAEGLGAVILICPKALLAIYEHHLPFVIKKPVGTPNDDHFKQEHLEEVIGITEEKAGTVLLGPGLGREESTASFVSEFLPQNTLTTVIDADGLWCLAQQSDWEKPEGATWILTPHPGELARLTGREQPEQTNRLETVKEFSAAHRVTTLSKGMPGIVGTTNGQCFLTNYDTRQFARAGSGDILAGKVSAYLACQHAPVLSCMQGLLRGKEKLTTYHKNNYGVPEPSDLI